MLTAYPVSKQWFWLLAERLDAVTVLYRVAAMVADADPRQDTIRVDHYRRDSYDLPITPASSTRQALSGGRTVGLIRQGPMLPGSNLRYRLRSIGHLPRNERPFLTLVLTHADQATRRAIRALGDPTEHRRTFVATEGEMLAGDHAGVVWQQCGSGLGQDPPVLVTPETSLSGILPWAEVLLGSSHQLRRDNPMPDPDGLYPSIYPSNVQAAMPEPARQLAASLSTRRPAREERPGPAGRLAPVQPGAAGRTDGRVTLRRVNQVLRSLRERDLVQEDGCRLMLTDPGLTHLARRDRAAVGLTLDRWTAGPPSRPSPIPKSTAAPPCASWPPRCATTAG